MCRIGKCMTRSTTSLVGNGQLLTFHQSGTPRLSTGNLFCSYCRLKSLQDVDASIELILNEHEKTIAHIASLAWNLPEASNNKCKHTHRLLHTQTSSIYSCRSARACMQTNCSHAVFSIKATNFCSSHFNSKPLKPSTSSNKPLPLIKVIEIKSWSGCTDERRAWNGQTFWVRTEFKQQLY